MSATVKIRSLPTLMFANDYHEIVDMHEQFQCMGISLKVDEICFDSAEGRYVGIVYSGRYPSKSKIEALIKKFGVEPGEDVLEDA